MILVADSGSTKADWKLFDGEQILDKTWSTKGFNPFFHGKEFIVGELSSNPELNELKDKISKVFFFGAACSSKDRNEKIASGLRAFFVNADVSVDHDLNAAVLATKNGNSPCITCILGTGSNAAYYDGEKLHDGVPALSYVLGDEGSGSYYGKRILASYLYNRLPPKMHNQLRDEYGLTKEEIFDNVYNQAHPNVYLASFARFLSDHKEYHYVKRLVYQGMLEFMDIHVCSFENYKDVKTHFIGSIAYYFEDILREVAERRQVQVGKIIKQPIHSLAKAVIERQHTIVKS